MDLNSRIQNYILKLNSILISTLFCTVSAANGISESPSYRYVEYKVKQGDNLSKILYDNNIKPIYGKRGFVFKAIKANNELIFTHGHKLEVGQIILVPTLDSNSDQRQIANSNDPISNQEVKNNSLENQFDKSENKHKKENSKQQLEDSTQVSELFQYAFYLGQDRVDAQDELTQESAIFLSDYNFKLEMQMLFPITEKSTLYGLLQYNYERYIDIPNANIENLNFNYYDIGLGFSNDLNSVFKFAIDFKLAQKLFVVAKENDLYSFLKLKPVEISLALDWNFFRNNLVQLNWINQIALYSDASVSTYSSQSFAKYASFIEMQRIYLGRHYTLQAGYSFEQMKTSISKQKRQDALIGLQFKY